MLITLLNSFSVDSTLAETPMAGVGGSSGGSSRSWSDILSDRKLYADFPKIAFNGTRYIHINKVCQDGSDLRTRKMLPIYDFVGFSDNVDYVEVGRDYVWTSIVYEKKDCLRERSSNCSSSSFLKEHKLIHNVRVRRNRGHDSNRKVEFVKEYKLPICDIED